VGNEGKTYYCCSFFVKFDIHATATTPKIAVNKMAMEKAA